MRTFWRREVRGVEVGLWRCTTWMLIGVTVDRHPSECTVTVHLGPLAARTFWMRGRAARHARTGEWAA